MLEFIRRVDSPSARAPGSEPLGPIEVIDGDGIRRDGVLYRLAGFDAPEIITKSPIEKERGLRAFARLEELVEGATDVRLEPIEKMERSKRTVVKLILDGKDVRDIAIEEGWGQPFDGRSARPDWKDPRTPFRTPGGMISSPPAFAPNVHGPIRFIDGDSFACDGVKYRLDGYDAPEIHTFATTLERDRGYKAVLRIKELHGAAKSVEIRPTGKRSKYGDTLTRLVLDGQDVTETAKREGWGAEYHGKGPKPDWGNPDFPFPDDLPGIELPDEPSKRPRKSHSTTP